MNYLFCKIKPGDLACRLKTLQGVEDDYELLRGISRKSDFPSDACFEMNENFPDNLQFQDGLFNRNDVLIISQKLKDFLEEEKLKNNEFLPVSIINHKGRKCKEKYYILHQVNLQDCIDLDKTIAKVNNMDPGELMYVKKMYIEEAKIDPDVAIFRMARYPFVVIIKRDLAEKIRKADFTGLYFGEIEEYKEK